jgi:hypothetical protein
VDNVIAPIAIIEVGVRRIHAVGRCRNGVRRTVVRWFLERKLFRAIWAEYSPSNGEYIVLFCGPGGCGDPAKEKATPITGDKQYDVLPNGNLRIIYNDSFAPTYRKCTSELTPTLSYGDPEYALPQGIQGVVWAIAIISLIGVSLWTAQYSSRPRPPEPISKTDTPSFERE